MPAPQIRLHFKTTRFTSLDYLLRAGECAVPGLI